MIEYERNGRHWRIIEFGVLLGGMYFFARRYSISLADVGVSFETPARLAAVGLAAGLGLLALRVVVGLWCPRIDSWEPQHPLARGRAWIWVILLVVGALAEEFWRALSLVTFLDAGCGIGLGVAATSIAFTLGHVCGIPSRMRGFREEILFTALVGVILAALFLAFRTLFVPCVAQLVLNLTTLYTLRRPPRANG